jgi:hypothetical protein
MIRATCQIPSCDWVSQWWLFDTHAKDEATWHAYDNHPDEWKTVIGDRPPQNPRPPNFDEYQYVRKDDMIVFTSVYESTDVTSEVFTAAEIVYDGWFADKPKIDWFDFIDRLDSTPLEDGTILDLGDDMFSTAIQAIIQHVRNYKKAGK